jgi:hypothetical protein
VFNKFHVLTLYSNFKEQREQCKRAFPRKEERKMYHAQKTRPTNPNLIKKNLIQIEWKKFGWEISVLMGVLELSSYLYKTSLNPVPNAQVCVFDATYYKITTTNYIFQNLSIYDISHVFVETLAAKNLDVCTACDLWNNNIQLTIVKDRRWQIYPNVI